jgi:hypothetical protein
LNSGSLLLTGGKKRAPVVPRQEPQDSNSNWAIKAPNPPAVRKKRKISEVDKADPPPKRGRGRGKEESAGGQPSSPAEDLKKPDGKGIGPYSSEWYRATLYPDEGMFKSTDFTANGGSQMRHAATIITNDMTHHFNHGLVIPADADRDWRGTIFELIFDCTFVN